MIDTNIVVEILKGNLEVRKIIDENYEVFIPSVLLGELMYGCYNSKNPKKHLEQVNNFTKATRLLNTNENVCNYYAKVKTSLRKKGKPIPENDVWIAAFSLAYKVTLFSFDQHFKLIPNFKFIKNYKLFMSKRHLH